MRRIVKGFLWVIKGMLLAIALAALGLWAWNHYAGDGHAQLDYFAVKSERVDYLGFEAAWWDGRIGIGRWRWQCMGEFLSKGRETATKYGAGWQGKLASGRPYWTDGNLSHFALCANPPEEWGVVRWQVEYREKSGYWAGAWYGSVSFWVAALGSGAWPVASLALLLRRRAQRRRRLARSGCRLDCGYDLRATPHAGGKLLERCPECGSAQSGDRTTPRQ